MPADAPEEATEEEPEPVEPVAIAAASADQADSVEPVEVELATTAAAPASPIPTAAVADAEPVVAPEPAVAVPEPAIGDRASLKVEAREPGADSPREVRDSGRRNRFRDGPDLFGRGFARSDPVKLESIKSDKPDRAKPDPAKPDPAKPELGKREVGDLDFAKLDFGATPLREGGRDPGSRDLLARAIPSELGAPDVGSRNPPLTDAALRVRLNTMLGSPDLTAPRKGGAEEPADGQADAEKAEPALDPVATKPPSAVERLSDIGSAARSRRADVGSEHEAPKLSPGAPPVPVPAPEPQGARRAAASWRSSCPSSPR